MMKQLVESFPEQLEEGMEIGKAAKFKNSGSGVKNVLIVGMGGSGIGANFTATFASKHSSVPFFILKDYQIPNWVDEHTLGIASSYSGNTEETLSAFEEMLNKKAEVVCISSGGKLLQAALENNLNLIKLPEGKPAPRACLGYSLTAQLYGLHHCGLINNDFEQQLLASITLLKTDKEEIKEKAMQVAGLLTSKLPVIYSTAEMEAIAVRFRQQLNENSKLLCWHHVIPEMNHNELVGWYQQYPNILVILIRTKSDHPRNKQRIDFVKEVANHYSSGTIEIMAKGDSYLERSIYLNHLFDWVSVYLAEKRGVDVMSIKVIDTLKQMLKDS